MCWKMFNIYLLRNVQVCSRVIVNCDPMLYVGFPELTVTGSLDP